MSLIEILGMLGFAAGTSALIVSVSATRGIGAAARLICKLVKADPPKYGFKDYCDFYNDPQYKPITKYCDSNGC
ncbi:hypothetical protein [Kaarinaea lacus]